MPGGSEEATRNAAEHLLGAGLDVEILSTCIKDFYADWGQNHHKPGLYQVNGVPVRRFPVEKRDQHAFDQVNWRLLNNLSVSAAEEYIFVNEMIRAPALYAYIQQNARDYLFFFTPYLYATTIFGCQIIPERSIVIANLHDEAYARLPIFREILPKVKGLVLKTNAEKLLSERLLGSGDGQIKKVIGDGIDMDVTADGDRFRQKYGLQTPFILYAGRREPGKNTPLLLDYWGRYLSSEGRDIKLVLIGPGQAHVPDELKTSVVDLGFVPVQDKLDAYAAAYAFCQPSVRESFSIVIMESWRAGKPVLVNGDCTVTVEHCRNANGGLYFAEYAEFAATLDFLFDNPGLAHKLGQQGRQYVRDNFSWKIIVGKYRNLLDEVLAS